MKTLVLFVTSLLCFACVAGDLQQVTTAVYKLQAEKNSKEAILRAKLITGLQSEEKEAQKAGKLELVLAIRARLAEIDSNSKQGNPFNTEESNQSVPVAGSAAEKAYLTGMEFVIKEYQVKINLIRTPLEAKKVALTKAGKIQEALDIEEILAALDPETTVKGIAYDQVYYEKYGSGEGLWLLTKDGKCHYLQLGKGFTIASGEYKEEKGKIVITWKNNFPTMEVTPLKDEKIKLVRNGRGPSELTLVNQDIGAKYEKEVNTLKSKAKIK